MKLGVDPDIDKVWLLGINPFVPSSRTLERSKEAEDRHHDWRAVVKATSNPFVYTMMGPFEGKYLIYAPSSNLAIYAAIRETARWTKKREKVIQRRRDRMNSL